MTTPDIVAVLARAEQRWCKDNADDPRGAGYLEQLVVAVQAVVGQPAVVVAGDAEIERLRGELAAARADVQRRVDRAVQSSKAASQALRDKLDALRLQVAEERHHRDFLWWLYAEAAWRLEVERDHHARTIAERDETVQALEAARAARDTVLNQARVYQTEAAETLELLGRLVDAINEEWHPDGDIPAQVEHAIVLVGAAADQLNTRHSAGQHIHQYPMDQRTDRVKPCACGKRFPKTARAALTTPAKGDAA